MPLRRLAKLLSMEESWVGYKRSVNDVQWLMPMVWPPESATTSVGLNFLVASEERMILALLKGAGRLSSVVCLVAKLRPSRLPKGTRYSGPPDCSVQKEATLVKVGKREKKDF